MARPRQRVHHTALRSAQNSIGGQSDVSRQGIERLTFDGMAQKEA